MLGHGTVIGWLSPVTPLLLSKETPLETGPLTPAQLSWIGSLTVFGGLVGPILFGYITSCIGSKRTLFLLTIPTMTFWIIVFNTNTFEWLVVGLYIAGLTGSSTLTSVVLFVSDIANDKQVFELEKEIIFNCIIIVIFILFQYPRSAWIVFVSFSKYWNSVGICSWIRCRISLSAMLFFSCTNNIYFNCHNVAQHTTISFKTSTVRGILRWTIIISP